MKNKNNKSVVILKSEKSGLYLVRPNGWDGSVTEATPYSPYNPFRFIMKWYISIKYEPVVFRRAIFYFGFDKDETDE